jgi:hypothetical protein
MARGSVHFTPPISALLSLHPQSIGRVQGRIQEFKIESLRAALWVQGKHWWGSLGQSPRKLLNFRNWITCKTCLPRSHFYYISVIINWTNYKLDKIDKMTQILHFFFYCNTSFLFNSKVAINQKHCFFFFSLKMPRNVASFIVYFFFLKGAPPLNPPSVCIRH